eukprot:XP_025980009.1 uncharacterized protein LOC112998171 [Glycine max]
MELNIKAKYTLTCAQSKNKYKKIYKLRTAKEIWESLSINYEDTEDVKLRKVMTLTRRYERFIMKDGEFVDGMFRRLQVLLNNLGTIGHMYSKDQINLKGLDSFPKLPSVFRSPYTLEHNGLPCHKYSNGSPVSAGAVGNFS